MGNDAKVDYIVVGWLFMLLLLVGGETRGNFRLWCIGYTILPDAFLTQQCLVFSFGRKTISLSLAGDAILLLCNYNYYAVSASILKF